MGALLESGLVGNIGLKHLKVIKEDTINKWEKLGFLDDLEGHTKENMAQLYENQASHLINEATTTDSSGSFETVVFPIIRRVFSKLLANDIVSVQAMNLPIGKLFFFVPKIQDRRSTTGHYAPKGSHGNTASEPNQAYDTGFGAKNLYDSFYEDSTTESGIFDYSKGAYSAITLTATAVKWSNGAMTAATYTGSTSSVILALTGFINDGNSLAGAGKLIGPSGNVIDTEEFLASLKVVYGGTERSFRLVTQKYGKGIVQGNGGQATGYAQYPGGKYNVVDTTGTIYLEADVDTYTAASGFTPVVLTNETGTGFTVTHRIYKDLEFEEEIGEVSFDLQSVTVSVTDRKLRASWSPELAQDVSAFHNIDAEAELTALLSEQIAAEIDREILRDLRKGAAWKLKWDYNEWRRLGGTGAAIPYTQKDWNQTLITKINQLSAQIHKSTLRGGANWVVVSSEVSAVFDDLEYFHVSNASPEQDQYNMGIEKIGTLAGRYQVYRDPYFPAGKILIGHKGTSLLDSGYIYAPYVPLQLTPTMYNPFNMTPIKGIMTRYAKKMVNNRFYGTIDVYGIQVFDYINELR
jgi:hypothetical protein